MNELNVALREALQKAATNVLASAGLDLTSHWKDLSEKLKSEVYTEAIKLLLGNDETTISTALLTALKDNAISSKEWKDVLTLWAKAQAGGDEVAQDLITVLDDQKITTAEAVQIAVKWAKRQVSDKTIQALLDGISADGFDVSVAWDAFKVFLKNAGVQSDLADRLIDAVEVGGKIGKIDLYLLIAALAAATSQEQLAQYIKRLANEPPQTVLLAYLNSWLPEEIKGLIEKILAQDWPAVISMVLGLANIELGADLIQNLAKGRIKEVVVKTMTDFLTQQGVGHAGDVASTLVDLVTGARSLFVSGPEPKTPALNSPLRIAVWREIRETIYLCQLTLNAGSIVSTNPMSPPHVFQASKILFNTPIHDLIGPTNDPDHRKDFCNTLTAFLDVHFGARIRRFSQDNVLVLSEKEARPTSSTQCDTVFFKINGRLKNPV